MTAPSVCPGPSRTGMGLFAVRAFQPGKIVLRLRGKIRSYTYLLSHPGPIQDNAFRFGPVTYLSPEGELGDFLNHSCEPNAIIQKRGGRLVVTARAVIKKGKEICIDYATILAADDIWELPCACACGAVSCRGRIRSYASFPKALRARYIAEGLIPPFILRITEQM